MKKKSRKGQTLAGCGGLVVLVGVGLTCAVSGFFALIFMSISGVPDGAKDAVAIANRDSRVAAVFGVPLEATDRKSGGVTSFGNEEMLDTVVTVEGPKSKGTFRIAGQRKRGRLWSYDTLVLTPRVGQPIDLRKRPR